MEATEAFAWYRFCRCCVEGANFGRPPRDACIEARAVCDALSLSYFKSEVLRPLLRAGSDIWLVADGLELHDNLERFYGGLIERENAFASLFPDLATGFAAALLGEIAQADIEAALASVLSQATIRQQLADALNCAAKGSLPPADWPVFATPLDKLLCWAAWVSCRH